MIYCLYLINVSKVQNVGHFTYISKDLSTTEIDLFLNMCARMHKHTHNFIESLNLLFVLHYFQDNIL